MTKRAYPPLVIAGLLACSLSGCGGGDDEPETRLEYTSTASVEAPPSDAGRTTSIETNQQNCLSSGGDPVAVPVPTAWTKQVEEVDRCEWSSGDTSITLTYGEVPEDDSEAWKTILDGHNAAELEDSIPGYAVDRYTANEGGGPLWHYRYVDAQADGGVYFDSLNLYRDGWQITYEAESSDYNTWLAEQFVKRADVS